MCGRYVLVNGKAVLQSFAKYNIQSIKDVWTSLPRYNASPGQEMPVVAFRESGLVAEKMRWWLVPHWSKDGKIQATTFNARGENIDHSKLFLPYFKSQRCLVPADAFYEWQKIKGGKQPICIRLKNGKTFYFAGLWSIWKNRQGEEFPSFTIITTTPNELMSDVHNRMPVIVGEESYERWLDRKYNDPVELKKLLKPFPSSEMETFKVTSYVSNSRNEGPECMQEIS